MKITRKYTRNRARKYTRKHTRRSNRMRKGGNPLMAIRLFGKAKKHYDSKKQPQVTEEEKI